MTTIAILDPGAGNLRSVQKALEQVGAVAGITADPEVAGRADGLILPGVGAFAAAIERLRERELDRAIAERLAAGTPVLGICLGFQLVFDRSSELGGAAGLGLIEGEVTGLEAPGLKVPHIGWEPVEWTRESALNQGIDERTPFYFAHGFTPRPQSRDDVLATAEHGERFTCAIARPPLHGVQFHPEKSGAAGLQLLANFANICARTSRLDSGGARLRPSDSASQPA